jgi:hypothetical protein
VREPYSVESPATVISGSEYIRWVQDCLNRILGLWLPLTGVLGPETRSAIRSFQKQQGLPVNGIVGPGTRDALQATCERRRPVDTRAADSEFSEELPYLRSVEDEDFSERESLDWPSPDIVTLADSGYVPLPDESAVYNLPGGTGSKPENGIYLVCGDGPTVYYVGMAQNIRERFQNRFSVFREFGMEGAARDYLTNNKIKVRSYVLQNPTVKGKDREKLLKVLEAYYIDKHLPANNLKNNQVTFTGGGITIQIQLTKGGSVSSERAGPKTISGWDLLKGKSKPRPTGEPCHT